MVTRSSAVGSQRWAIPFVLGVSLYVAFIDRMNLALAMPKLAEHYGWTTEEIGDRGGLLLGSFYIAYGLSNLFLSGFAARIGPRRSLIGLVCAFSFFTMLGAPLSYSLPLFVMTRVLLGVGEGVHFPMMNAVMKHWFPPFERSRANAIWGFGSMFAMMTMPFLLVPVIEHFGFRVMLVACGAIGMAVTVPLLYLFVFDVPRQSPRVAPPEAEWIEANLETEAPTPADWGFLKAPVFWVAVLGAILSNYCVYGIINWLPIYFTEARGVDFSALTLAAAAPYAAGFFSFVLYAYLGDKTNRRILLASVGFFGATGSLLAATVAPSVTLAVVAFSCATFFQTAYISQEFAILQRILPGPIIGKAAGVYNGFSVLFGAVGGTVLLGQIVSATGSYDAGLYSVMAATVTGGCVMLVLSRMVKY